MILLANELSDVSKAFLTFFLGVVSATIFFLWKYYTDKRNEKAREQRELAKAKVEKLELIFVDVSKHLKYSHDSICEILKLGARIMVFDRRIKEVKKQIDTPEKLEYLKRNDPERLDNINSVVEMLFKEKDRCYIESKDVNKSNRTSNIELTGALEKLKIVLGDIETDNHLELYDKSKFPVFNFDKYNYDEISSFPKTEAIIEEVMKPFREHIEENMRIFQKSLAEKIRDTKELFP